ncbi:MAG: hypothetical protein ACPL0C_03750 [Candidatus Bathyarchaeales archaeon]
MDLKKKTALLGFVFVAFLAIAYFENIMFYKVVGNFFSNQFLAMLMLFVHNTLAISLILLGMTFYVNLVLLNFFRREKYADILLQHPRIFAAVFTFVVLFLSILRVGSLTYGEIDIAYLPQILLISAPTGILEGYGIYLTISKTLSRRMSTKDLIFIYSIFLVAAAIEVGFINLLASTLS